MTYFEEAKGIWAQFVPQSGQATTVQGELLRSVEKLRNEAMRNGNANWDQGFEILLAYLGKHLLDAAAISPNALGRTEATLSRIRDHENPLLEDKPFDELSDRVVEYYRHYGSQPHTANPQLHR